MRVPLALLAALLTAGCTADLTRDDRLSFTAPADGARVETPVRVAWSPVRGADAYGVFVDRAPQKPGRDLASLARGDRVCRVAPGCPDATWFADHGVHVTVQPEIILSALPQDSGRPAGRWRRHRVTVVLLDPERVRVGEGAWSRTLYAREVDR